MKRPEVLCHGSAWLTVVPTCDHAAQSVTTNTGRNLQKAPPEEERSSEIHSHSLRPEETLGSYCLVITSLVLAFWMSQVLTFHPGIPAWKPETCFCLKAI